MTSTLLLGLVLAFAVILCVVSLVSKASAAFSGSKLDIDDDSVTISDSDMQDFLFQVAEKAREMKAVSNENNASYAVA